MVLGRNDRRERDFGDGFEEGEKVMREERMGLVQEEAMGIAFSVYFSFPIWVSKHQGRGRIALISKA